jgi:hypothetical protein
VLTKADNPVLNLVSPPIANIIALSGTLDDMSIGLSNPGPANFTTAQTGSLSLNYLSPYGVVLSGGSNPLGIGLPSINGQALVSNGPGAYPYFGLVSLYQVYGVLNVVNGGTGNAYLQPFNVMVGQNSSPVALVAPGSALLPLISTGPASNPTFGYLNLNTAVTNVLLVFAGGTGLNSTFIYDVMCGDGFLPISFSPVIGPGYPFISNGSTAFPEFQALYLGDGTTAGPGVTGVLPAANVAIPVIPPPNWSMSIVYGTSYFTIPSPNLKVTLVGGGGGGGNSDFISSDEGAAGGGGGSGGFLIDWLTGLTPGATLYVTVGTGGTPGNNGTDTIVASGSQTISTLTAGGGGGGTNILAIPHPPSFFSGGLGGTFSGGYGGDGTPGNSGYSITIVIGGAGPIGGQGGQLGIMGSYGNGGIGADFLIVGGSATNGFPGIVMFEWL